jgi:hypothetical protein
MEWRQAAAFDARARFHESGLRPAAVVAARHPDGGAGTTPQAWLFAKGGWMGNGRNGAELSPFSAIEGGILFEIRVPNWSKHGWRMKWEIRIILAVSW